MKLVSVMHAGVGEQLGHLADAADVLLAVGGGEAQVLVQAVADVVAVEHVGQVAALDQGVLEGEGDGALARAAQAGEPDGRALLLEQLLAVLAADVAFVPGDVRCSNLGHCNASLSICLPAS